MLDRLQDYARSFDGYTELRWHTNHAVRLVMRKERCCRTASRARVAFPRAVIAAEPSALHPAQAIQKRRQRRRLQKHAPTRHFMSVR